MIAIATSATKTSTQLTLNQLLLFLPMSQGLNGETLPHHHPRGDKSQPLSPLLHQVSSIRNRNQDKRQRCSKAESKDN